MAIKHTLLNMYGVGTIIVRHTEEAQNNMRV